jgi:O-methyltransferase
MCGLPFMRIGDLKAIFGRAMEMGEAPTSLENVIYDEVHRNHTRVFWGDRLLSLDKAAAFLDDPRFSASFEAIKAAHVYDQYDSPHTISWRLHTLVWAARNALHLPGDFVECGVFKGDMSWFILSVLADDFRDKKLFLYDSFCGFDPDSALAADYPGGSGFLDFANTVYREPGIESSVRARFADRSDVKITTGFLPSILEQLCPDQISYLHIDLNSPAAEVGCLERLFDRVVPGGVIVFDDYGWDIFRAQRIAEDAFFAARGYSVLELPTGQGMVVKR